MCCSGADHMASGDSSRIENAFAEAVLDSGSRSRALNTAETVNFRTTPLPFGSVGIPGALIPGMDGLVGLPLAPPGDALSAQIRAPVLICVRRRRHAVKFQTKR